MSVRALRSVVIACLLVFAGAAQAALTVYTSQAAFLAAVSAPGTDTFDDLPLVRFYCRSARPRPTIAPYSYTAIAST